MNSYMQIEARYQSKKWFNINYRFLNLPPFNAFKNCFIEELEI